MEFDCSKTHNRDGSFTFDSLVETDGFQNLHHLFDDSNGHILANNPSYGSSLFDDTRLQPYSSNTSLLSLGDVNTRNTVGGAAWSCNQNVGISVYNDNLQKSMEDGNPQYMIEHAHVNKSSPKLSGPGIHGIEPLKSFPLLNELSNLATERSKSSYDQGASMNSKSMQIKKTGGKANKIPNLIKGQWTLEEDR